jgi:hypothetical protein
VATDIAVDLAVVEALLGRIGDPKASGRPSSAMHSVLRAVMFTDIISPLNRRCASATLAALELKEREPGRGIRCRGHRRA